MPVDRNGVEILVGDTVNYYDTNKYPNSATVIEVSPGKVELSNSFITNSNWVHPCENPEYVVVQNPAIDSTGKRIKVGDYVTHKSFPGIAAQKVIDINNKIVTYKNAFYYLKHGLDSNRERSGFDNDYYLTVVDTPTKDQQLLTEQEHKALDLTTELATAVAACIDKSNFADDWNEIAIHIHNIQHAIMAQAAARAYPDKFRRLGRKTVDG